MNASSKSQSTLQIRYGNTFRHIAAKSNNIYAVPEFYFYDPTHSIQLFGKLASSGCRVDFILWKIKFEIQKCRSVTVKYVLKLSNHVKFTRSGYGETISGRSY